MTQNISRQSQPMATLSSKSGLGSQTRWSLRDILFLNTVEGNPPLQVMGKMAQPVPAAAFQCVPLVPGFATVPRLTLAFASTSRAS